MNIDEYKTLHTFEDFYWWHVGRREMVEDVLSRILKQKRNSILEIGCGTGGNGKTLGKFGEVIGIDPSEKAIRFCKGRGFHKVVLGRGEKTNFPPEHFDLVVALDVFEHMERDEAGFRESFRILKKGGYLLLTVPAYQFLWSEHDDALDHKRRYTVSQLRSKMQIANFEIVKISYLVTFLFPPIVLYRLGKKLLRQRDKKRTSYVIVPIWMNKFFVALLRFESTLLRYIDFPFGTSIICIARKR
ncbi:class I SAM-dependent methyltransferase [Patescibacteria group bacterium]|nr:class I SAM-dependent methyltransferase [Patescibacteria group bacterium]